MRVVHDRLELNGATDRSADDGGELARQAQRIEHQEEMFIIGVDLGGKTPARRDGQAAAGAKRTGKLFDNDFAASADRKRLQITIAFRICPVQVYAILGIAQPDVPDRIVVERDVNLAGIGGNVPGRLGVDPGEGGAHFFDIVGAHQRIMVERPGATRHCIFSRLERANAMNSSGV